MLQEKIKPDHFIVPGHLRWLVSGFLVLLVFFSLMRLLLLALNTRLLTPESEKLVWYALFNRGLLFDTVTACYVISLPWLLLSVRYLTACCHRFFIWSVRIYLFLASLLILAASVADIPYFAFYNARINRAVLAWTDDLPLMFQALLSNGYYLVFTGIFLLISVLLYFGLSRMTKAGLLMSAPSHQPLPIRIIVFLVSAFMLFVGLRGDFKPGGMPLLPQHAFETNYSFINQLGLNPAFNFIHSFNDFQLDYMDDDEAIAQARAFLGIRNTMNSTVARSVTYDSAANMANVVIVIMESMSADRMERFGNKQRLTPVLDSLARISLTFDNAYTAGIHTYNGVFSTLFGLPALMQNKPTMSSSSGSLVYSGISNVLSGKGYQTVFLTNGPREFDNFGGVLPGNGFQLIIDWKRFPKEKILNNWGVGDHYLFDYSLSTLDSLASWERPFLAVYMTVSTHSPYTIPPGIDFIPSAGEPRDKAYQYADWAIGRFLKKASDRAWYKNTIFVFVADHGQNFDPTYDLPLSYHHTPLIFHGPALTGADDRLSLQIDIFPTIMGILKIPYTNNTLGIDLQQHRRPFAYFSADVKLGVLDRDHFLIIDKNGRETLCLYREKSLENIAGQKKAKVDSMKRYAYSMLQTMQFMIKNRCTVLDENLD